jgi:nitrate/nitrite-specific signal transduction histidine kinase
LTGGDLQAKSLTAHVNIINSLENLGFSLLIGNLVAMLVAGGAALFVILYASHKIAGPLYRFEKLCQQIGDGQLDTVTSLRQHDQLQDLGTAFGDMVKKLRSRKEQRTQLIVRLNSEFEQLGQDPSLGSDQRERLEQIRQSLMQLQE